MKNHLSRLLALALALGCLSAIQLFSPSALSAAAPLPPSLMEKLDRGVVAVRATENTAYVSWRLLGTEPQDTAFNLYRSTDGAAPVKLNTAPLTQGTNFTDKTADFSKTNAYRVAAIDPATGRELALSKPKTVLNTLPASAPVRQYFAIPLRIPEGGVTPDGRHYTYTANDCSAADLDGDGEYEIVVKWDPTNAHDNAQDGYTGNVYLDAYKLDGTFLWRIDLGKNIRAGAHYTQFQVYDFDGDGLAEIACKTADGTIDGTGKVIGDPNADYRGTTGRLTGRILSGPEYLTIFSGKTGAALATTRYIPQRDPENHDDNPTPERQKELWGDNYGNRIDRFLACTAYLDGQRPSLVMCRGYYTRSVLAAWDYRDGKLTQRWVFDSDDGKPGDASYRDQGAHSVLVGDVNGDGCDEINYGAAMIGHDGKGIYSTGRGHGDAQHMTVMDPDRGGQQVWMIHEDPKVYGDAAFELHDARTGEIIFKRSDPSWKDIGRGCAGNIDPNHKGYQLWAGKGDLYDCKGNVISQKKPKEDNFMIWWDGDLLRELLDHVMEPVTEPNRGAASERPYIAKGNRKTDRGPMSDRPYIAKWNWKTETSEEIFTDPDCASNNGTKGTPCLSADLFGDWREEVIWRTKDNRELRIYTTIIPTDYRFFTLMHDRQYRTAIAWQNTAYNQPPHPSFYLGVGMTMPPKPNIVTTLAELQK